MNTEIISPPIVIPRSNVASVFTFRVVAAAQVVLVLLSIAVGALTYRALAIHEQQYSQAARV